jgi:chaperonin GroEL (HSP60 family)
MVRTQINFKQLSLTDITIPELPRAPSKKVLRKAYKDVEVEQLGTARKITVRSGTTTIIADLANKDEIQARIAQIKKEMAETDSVYDTEKLSERVAKLSGRVAVIKVDAVEEPVWKGATDALARRLKVC